MGCGRTASILCAAVLALCAGFAMHPVAAQTEGSADCGAAVDAAERRYGIPPGLLAAMARVESGRPGPDGVSPWPWTTNVNGRGRFYASKAEAVAEVRRMQDGGQVFIDVGCLQVDLGHHPSAFATLEEAFDPAANADYAARYLLLLATRFAAGDWMVAAGFYNTMTAGKADSYRAEVSAALGGRAVASAAPLPRPAAQPVVARAGTAPEDWLAVVAGAERHAWRQPQPLSTGSAMALASAFSGLLKGDPRRPGSQ